MSNDLISRQAVDKIINNEIRQTTEYCLHDTQINIKFAVQELPTAYDVERVIERLEECRDDIIADLKSNFCLSQCQNDDCVVCIFNKVFEIVRKGGID